MLTRVHDYAAGESNAYGDEPGLTAPPRAGEECSGELQEAEHGAQSQQQAQEMRHIALVHAQEIPLVQHLHLRVLEAVRPAQGVQQAPDVPPGGSSSAAGP